MVAAAVASACFLRAVMLLWWLQRHPHSPDTDHVLTGGCPPPFLCPWSVGFLPHPTPFADLTSLVRYVPPGTTPPKVAPLESRGGRWGPASKTSAAVATPPLPGSAPSTQGHCLLDDAVAYSPAPNRPTKALHMWHLRCHARHPPFGSLTTRPCAIRVKCMLF